MAINLISLHGPGLSPHTAAMMIRSLLTLLILLCSLGCRGAQQVYEDAAVETTDSGSDASVLTLPSDFPEQAARVLLGLRAVAPVVDGEVHPVMIQLIERAETQVCMLAFEFVEGEATSKVEDALVRAAARGVSVRVLVDETVQSSAGFVQRLASQGVSAKLDTVGKAHTKMMVADQRFALVGSTNLSTSSLRYNHEANLLFSTPSPVGTALDYCIQRYGDMAAWQDRISSPNSDPRVFGDGQGVDALKTAVQSAQERIDVVIYAINTNSAFPDGPVMTLLDQLGDAVARGVSVFVLLERSEYDPNLNILNEEAADFLRAKGALVRFDAPGTITHAKLLVADGVALVSTGNWTYGGLSQNHELTVRTVDEESVGYLRSYAQEIYTQGN